VAGVSLELRRAEAKEKAFGHSGKENKGGRGRGPAWWRVEEEAGGSSHGVGHEAKVAPSQEWQCQASGVRTARREERERDAKLAGGPPGEWGPAAEGEKKAREGDRWD
jgi:hypothetical protein